MAISTIAGVEGGGGVKLTCILYEGANTVTANVFGPDGYHDTGITKAAAIRKDQWVQIDGAADNTYDATNGLPVVETLAQNAVVIGKVISEPKWVNTPTANTVSWAGDLAGGWFRVATVWFPQLIGVAKVMVDNASTAAIVPGVVGTVSISAGGSNARAAAGAAETLEIVDVANGGTGIVPLTYVAADGVDVSLLVGFNGASVLTGA
ncbi:MAG TPA: hypothetical protein PK445_07200 [Methanolinea sp.]|nr:hypothetical protein [Methanolinea sp.]HQJ88432.1 hypothetical protein [Methanoregulaceae archaeon]